MWNRIRRWLGGDEPSEPERDSGSEYTFKWYDPGDENPFPVRILDVRSLTMSVVATTSDQTVAEMFNAQRLVDGREFIDAEIENVATIDCNLTLPHGGERLEGIVFKSDSMDVKWDIYIYDSVFLFTRSWLGTLEYRAFADVTDNAIRINKIEASKDQIDTAAQAVYFLLASHAMGRAFPHTIPPCDSDDPYGIAVLSFSMYGNRGRFATYDDITRIEISAPTTDG